MVKKVCVVPGAKVTVKFVELPAASVAGSWLSVNGVFGLLVVVVIDTSPCGFKAADPLLVKVKGMVTVAVVRTLPKLIGVVALGCSKAPEHWLATLLLHESVMFGAVPAPSSVPIQTGKPATFACR